jgi:hypothetical protein
VKLDGAELNRDAALVTWLPIRRRWPSAKERGAALFHISGALTLEGTDDRRTELLMAEPWTLKTIKTRGVAGSEQHPARELVKLS